MSGKLRNKLTRPSIWLRLVSMIVLAIAFNIAEIVIFAVVVFQFLASLFTRRPNAQFTRFGRNLARYLEQIIAFMTFATEEKPFPFSQWPDVPLDEPPVVENDKTIGSSQEAETVVKSAEPAKSRKPAPRKTAPRKTAPRKAATTRKPRSPSKKGS